MPSPREIDSRLAFRLYRAGLGWRDIAKEVSRLSRRHPPFQTQSVQYAVHRDFPDYASKGPNAHLKRAR